MEPDLPKALQVLARALDKKEPELHEAFQTVAKALNKAAKEDKLHESFEGVAAAMLTISTFAAGITFNLLLKPSNPSPPTRAFIFLAYANALFCAALMGCALIKISIELIRYSFDPAQKLKDKAEISQPSEGIISFIREHDRMPTFVLGLETSVVGAVLFVAIYLLLYSSSLFLQVRGPLILGSILYGTFGAIVCSMALISMLIRYKLRLKLLKGTLFRVRNDLFQWRTKGQNDESETNRREEGSADDDKKGIMSSTSHDMV